MQITPDSISYSVSPNLKKPPAEPKLEMVNGNSKRVQANSEVSKLVEDNFQAESEEKRFIDKKTLKEVADSLNEISRNFFRRYSFDVVEEANDLVSVTISDAKSGEVIKQIPSEEFVEMMSRVNEFVGMLIDETV